MAKALTLILLLLFSFSFVSFAQEIEKPLMQNPPNSVENSSPVSALEAQVVGLQLLLQNTNRLLQNIDTRLKNFEKRIESFPKNNENLPLVSNSLDSHWLSSINGHLKSLVEHEKKKTDLYVFPEDESQWADYVGHLYDTEYEMYTERPGEPPAFLREVMMNPTADNAKKYLLLWQEKWKRFDAMNEMLKTVAQENPPASLRSSFSNQIHASFSPNSLASDEAQSSIDQAVNEGWRLYYVYEPNCASSRCKQAQDAMVAFQKEYPQITQFFRTTPTEEANPPIPSFFNPSLMRLLNKQARGASLVFPQLLFVNGNKEIFIDFTDMDFQKKEILLGIGRSPLFKK